MRFGKDFGQGDNSLGWRKWLEPVTFSRPETIVVGARAGKAGAGVQAEAAGLALGPRGRPKGKPEPDLTPTKFNTRPLS